MTQKVWGEHVFPFLGVLDPAVAQAIGVLSAAIAMLIISFTSYYFPRGHDRFDKEHHNDDDESRHHDDSERG